MRSLSEKEESTTSTIVRGREAQPILEEEMAPRGATTTFHKKMHIGGLHSRPSAKEEEDGAPRKLVLTWEAKSESSRLSRSYRPE